MTRFRWWMPLVLAALCAAAYANTLHAPFIFDDSVTIQTNPAIRRLWPLFDVTATTPPALWGRPLVSLSLKINYALGGYDVVGYHLFNLLVHILNATLAFGILRRTLLNFPGAAADQRDATGPAYAAVVLWMLHPLATESVTYVTQRTELLMGFFLLSTLYCVVRGTRSPHRKIWYGLAVISCILGMGAKEVMAVTPLLVFLCDRVFGAPSPRAAVRNRAGLYVGLAASWIVLAALQITTNLQWKSGAEVSPLGCWDYLAMQCSVLTRYLRLAIWPKGLVLDYSDWPRTILFASLLPRAFLLLALLAATAGAIRRRQWWGFWGAWFFLLLAPSSSFLPLPTEPAAERRMYLPLLAVMAVMVGTVWRSCHRLSSRFSWPDRARMQWETAVALALAVALGVTTFQRNEQYRSAESIWADVVAKRPQNARAQTNLAIALVDEGKTTEAIPHFLAALRLDPDQPIIRNDYASALVDIGRIDDAIAQYQEALRRAPNFTPARKALGQITQRQFRDSIERCQAALAAHRDDPSAHIRFAQLLADMGRRDEAIAQYEQALRLDPQSPGTHYNLANLLTEDGRDSEAISHYVAAVQLAPRDPRIQINLGNLFLKQARWDDAIAAYTQALRIDPSAFEAHNNLAIALADRGDLIHATEQLREAAHLKPDDPDIHRELAELLDRQGLHVEAQHESAEAQRLTQSNPPN
ncbi:MAG TPA: tetratricopeptide repeat protein [Verrucomicrobiae bacterium]|nr:tetratricopeptide repeat protein [Verrucomicrobiae bacterium]